MRPISALWLRWVTRPFTRFHLALLVSVCVCVCMCDCSVNLSIISLTLNCPLEMSKGSIKLMLSPTSQIVKYHTQSVTLKLHFHFHCSFSFSYVRIQFVSVCFSWMCIFVCMHECIISTIITFTLTLGTCDSIVKSNMHYANASPLRVFVHQEVSYSSASTAGHTWFC